MDTSTPKQLKPYAHLISDIDRDSDGAWNVGLKNGFICSTSETHAVFELELATVVSIFKAGEVVPCACKDCVPKRDFDAALAGFMKAAQAKVDERFDGFTYANAGADLHTRVGAKYIKVVSIDKGHTSGSVFCFIDKATGDVLKAAGWSAPAKGVRSNIFADDFGAAGVTGYGAVYAR